MRHATANYATNYELPPVGKYTGIVCGVALIGTHPSLYGPSEKVTLLFELHKRSGPVKNKEGFVFTITSSYPFTIGVTKSLFRTHAITLLPPNYVVPSDGIDPELLLGRIAIVDVVHTDGETKYANIKTMSRHDKDEDYIPEPQLDSWVYDIEVEKEIPDFVPKMIAGMVKKSSEWVARHGSATNQQRPPNQSNGKHPRQSESPRNEASDDEDIPF